MVNYLCPECFCQIDFATGNCPKCGEPVSVENPKLPKDIGGISDAFIIKTTLFTLVLVGIFLVCFRQ